MRPVTPSGDLDLEKISRSGQVLQFEKKEKIKKLSPINRVAAPINFHDIKNNATARRIVRRPQEYLKNDQVVNVYQFGQKFRSESVPIILRSTYVAPSKASLPKPIEIWEKKEYVQKNISKKTFQNMQVPKQVFADRHIKKNVLPSKRKRKVNWLPVHPKYFSTEKISKNVFAWNNFRQFALSFSSAAAVIFLIIFGIDFLNRGIEVRKAVLGTGKEAYVSLAMAKDGIAGRDFQKSSFEFSLAHDKFGKISQDIHSLGGILVEASRFVPFLSKLSSGEHMAQAGKDISQIGILAGEIMQSMDEIKNPLENNVDSSVSFLEIFQDTDKNLKEISRLTQNLQNNLNKVNVDDIPESQRLRFVELKSQLPEINNFLAEFINNSQIFTDVLGGNGPRKYLFLFQNNQEMRATGGFIGTYGVLDIFNGNVRRFFIDGIFNPDGQLREKVIPPAPIQKISAAWSLHDSNWFPDFPKSAEKAAWFYEKTGGPTVDGVITMTPTVMQKLLEITGPIELPEYDVTVDKDNFVEKIQYEVEVDYDKELNTPKQIIADLAPKILDKIFNARNFSDIARTMNVLLESLNEKQILIYSKNYEIEKILSKQGWSGEVLDTAKDYLSVINTNINGYKTDGVVDEKISHKAEIQPDGSIIDTVVITRHHNGGNLKHTWWNKVNADYLRVYVPKGSILLSADGQTREYNSPPLDYTALGFKKDAQVQMEEDSLQIDEDSGTRIYDDSGKTVFANWAYVSPQETVVITYKYLLPFKLTTNDKNRPADSYSLLVQKQSGSLGDEFVSEISFADNYKMIWNYPDDVARDSQNIKVETSLKTDQFIGAAFMQR